MIRDSSEPSAVQQIRDVVALGASLVGLIYVSGVLIVGLRPHYKAHQRDTRT
jgi:hypothetical protein